MKRLLLLALFVGLMTFFCGPDRHWDTDTNICGQELCYQGPFDPPWISAYDCDVYFVDIYNRELPCDNKVLETDNVLTFSDASSDEVKIEYARMTEVSLAEIKAVLGIPGSQELGITDLYTKFRIYSDRYYDYGQAAVGNGFLLYGLDSPHWGDRPQTDPEFHSWYQCMVKHETVHVVQYCLGGIYSKVHFWFTEGLGEEISGGVFPSMTCWPEVEAWSQDPDHVNPISIHDRSDHPNVTSSSWYAMFHLAVQYLLDPEGHNRTPADVKAMFADVGNGVMFTQAFETRMGMSVADYQDRFWEFIQAYLPADCGGSRIDGKAPERKRAFEVPGSKKSGYKNSFY